GDEPGDDHGPHEGPDDGVVVDAQSGRGSGEGEFGGAVHGEGHSPGHHERADEAAADGDQRGRQQRVLGEGLLEQESDAHQCWCPSALSPPTMMTWPCTRITSMWVPYRALRLGVVSTVSGDPAAQRPAA